MRHDPGCWRRATIDDHEVIVGIQRHLIGKEWAFGLRRSLDEFLRIVATLDECRSFGSLYDVLDQAGTPVSYVTNGQNVPQDIEDVSAREMARLIISNTLH